jgi:glycosyltransferase involved in cell wall biosynthesis
MKIGIEAQRIFRPKKHGMDVVAIELIKNLQELDKTNEYFVFSAGGVNDIFSATSNFHFKSFSSFIYADWEQLQLSRQLKKTNLDLLHCTANTAPLKLSLPLIVTIHDIIYLEKVDFRGTAYQNLGNLYRRFIVPKIAEKARLIITVSEFEKRNIVEKLNLPQEKIKVLYNGVSSQFNTDYPKEDVEEFRKAYGLPNQFIMFLGNTAPKKNTLNVIRAYLDYCQGRSTAIPLVLLDYKREFVSKILQQANASHLISNFVFPGYVPYNKIPLMYNAATLFLYPSLRESFGLPILEAMACGVPVITSNCSSMPEVAGSAAEIIDPFNHKDLSNAINRILESEDLKQIYRKKGVERSKQFTWRKTTEDLLQVYETLATK